jgi:heme exporter protein C
MIWKIVLLLLFIWVIIAAWSFVPPMSGVQTPEVYRIFYFHWPVALVTFMAYAFAMYQAIRYLKSKNLDYDFKSNTAALLGTIFCVLATISGSIFAKFAWGSFWNWDPRETSITVVLLIYLAYFSLRSAVNDPAKKANLSAVYAILGFIAAFFAIFIWPRIMPGLHPGSPGGESSARFIAMSGTTRLVVFPSLAAFIVLYGWIYSLAVRVHRLQQEAQL